MRTNLRKAPRDPRRDPRRTPAKPSEQVRGSDTNKPGSASTKGGKITLSKNQEEWIADQVRDHNAAHTAKSKKVTSRMLKAVMRRGMGAFSSTHHPSMSRDGWGRARVRHFLHLASKGKPKNERYVQDNDLLPTGHPKKTQSKNPIDWEAEFKELERKKDSFLGEAKERFRSAGTVITRGADFDFITLTRSTYPGVNFQVTRWDIENGQLTPLGHTDIRGDLKDAVEELWWHTFKSEPQFVEQDQMIHQARLPPGPRLSQVKDLPASKRSQVRNKLQRALASVGGYGQAGRPPYRGNEGNMRRNHDGSIDYEKASEIAAEWAAKGFAAWPISVKLQEAGFDKALADGIAIATERRQELARLQRQQPGVRSRQGAMMESFNQGIIKRDEYVREVRRLREEQEQGLKHMRNPAFTEEEAFAALQTRLATPIKFAATQVERGCPPDQATRLASAQYGLTEHDTDILHYIMDSYEALSVPMVANASPTREQLLQAFTYMVSEDLVRALDDGVPFEKAVHGFRNTSWYEDNFDHYDQLAGRLTNDDYRVIAHALRKVEAHDIREEEIRRFAPNVKRFHASNRTALEIGTHALYVPDGEVVKIIGYEAGRVVVAMPDGKPEIVSHSDLSHDAYELQVATAMSQLMEGTDPSRVVKNLINEDVNENFALTAMEEAAERLVEVR